MDFSRIDSFMQKIGLASEPAFDYLHFLNEPIPQTTSNRQLLGLYYPDGGHDQYGYLPPSTIHLPPNASYSTLLHELGHRYGHYYYDDLSEGFAENYRKAHEGGGFMSQVFLRETICQGCPEMKEGRSKLCLYCDYGGRYHSKQSFSVNARVGPLRLRGPVGAVITGSISKVEVAWKGVYYQVYPTPSTPVQIPAGDPFDVYITFSAHNPSDGQWEFCTTVLSSDGQAHFDMVHTTLVTLDKYNLSARFRIGDHADLSNMFTMPSSSITLRITPWVNPVIPSPNDPPPQNLW